MTSLICVSSSTPRITKMSKISIYDDHACSLISNNSNAFYTDSNRKMMMMNDLDDQQAEKNLNGKFTFVRLKIEIMRVSF